jgi:hypothetical protein
VSSRDYHAEIAGSEERVLAALGIPWKGRDHIRCPFPDHDDKRPSWRWGVDKRGRPRWFCTCGNGSIFDAVIRMGKARDFPEALRFAFGDLPPMPSGTYPKLHKATERKQQHRHICAVKVPKRAELVPPKYPKYGPPSAFWAYHNEHGGIYEIRARYDLSDADGNPLLNEKGKREKAVLPWFWNGRRWVNLQAPGPRPLFNLLELLAEPEASVLFVAGEKTAHAGSRLFDDYVATTSSGGEGAWRGADYSPLNGRSIIIWPDNDKAGLTYAEGVARCCHGAGAASIRIVDVPQGWPEGWDLADEPPSDSIDLMDILTDARAWGPDA